MSATDALLSETDIRPAGAEVWTVRADADDARPWLSGTPVCPGLARVRHLGVARMPSPFEIVRALLGGSYFLACFGGAGRVRFARPAGMDARLWRLWERVAADLAAPWTVTAMAAEAHLSEKQLQRLCRKGLGRNPRRQLIWLRVRHAAELLSTGRDKVETVAARVGYQNPFVFSTTFKRVTGWSPSESPCRRP